MRNVSEAYKQNTTDTTQPRAAKAMVEFCIVEEAGEYSEECSPYYGFVDQIFDEENESTGWATCEPGRLVLDGSMCAPNYTQDFKYGYISQAMSDAAGSTDITLRIQFVESKVSKGLTLCFQEPVHDFTLMVEGTAYTVKDNQALQVYLEHYEPYQEIVLHITKVEPHRRVRITQIFLGAVMSYGNEKLITLTSINEISLDNSTLPADSATFGIMNENNEFDILNPEGLYNYLKENQPVNVYIGIRCGGGYEYARIGRYFVAAWSTKGMVATFEAYTAVYGMDEDEYRFGQIKYRDLYAMLDELLDDAGVDHDIDPSLERLTVSGYISTVSRREALRMMIEAGCCTATSDARGRLIIRPRAELPGEVDPYEVIDGDNLTEWPTLKQKKNYASAEVTINTFTEEAEEATLFDGTAQTITGKLLASGKYKVWVPYDGAPAKDVKLSGADQYDLYACGAYVYIEQDAHIQITGFRVSVKQENFVKTKYSYDNPRKISNTLIISQDNAEKIADYALVETDLTGEAPYTGFPYMEAGDPTEWHTKWGAKKLFLTKNTLEFSGALSGRVEGAGKVGS